MEKENAELTIQTKIMVRYCFHFRMAKMPLHIGTLHDVLCWQVYGGNRYFHTVLVGMQINATV